MSDQQLLGTRVLPNTSVLPFIRYTKNNMKQLFLHWKTEVLGAHLAGAVQHWVASRLSSQSSPVHKSCCESLPLHWRNIWSGCRMP